MFWVAKFAGLIATVGGNFLDEPYLVWGIGAFLHYVMKAYMSHSYFGRCPRESIRETPVDV